VDPGVQHVAERVQFELSLPQNGHHRKSYPPHHRRHAGQRIWSRDVMRAARQRILLRHRRVVPVPDESRADGPLLEGRKLVFYSRKQRKPGFWRRRVSPSILQEDGTAVAILNRSSSDPHGPEAEKLASRPVGIFPSPATRTVTVTHCAC